ncbi:choice-of-anchor J domain-containing protein [Crocinitomix catalasitica]|nr:choice-of-anchor J domain-containing protein [Crocinitomix catalasitica]
MKRAGTYSIFLFIAAMILMTSCKKEYDSPPENVLNASSIVTIDSLRNWQTLVGGPVSIQDSISVYGIVTMDESSGNIYKNIYLQDHTGAINVRFTSSTDLIEGDSIRISLMGTVLNEFSGVIQLDSVDEDLNVIVQSSGNYMTPKVMTIDQIGLDNESQLIKINSVQFLNSELLNTWADAVGQNSENRIFEDCNGNQLYIRTSGFADFAGDSLPKFNGSIVCIVSEYLGDLQLILRSVTEAQMGLSRCAGQILVKDFDDNSITSGGWTVAQVIGTDTWVTSTAGSAPSPYADITNWEGGVNEACENWLISPEIDLTVSSTPLMSFINAYNFGGPALELLVSTDFSGTGDPNGASWVALSAIWDTNAGTWEWTASGDVDLSPFIGNKIYIAFKYTGSSTDGSEWEIDDIKING